MMYNAGTDRTVDCELAWSPDSVQLAARLPGHAVHPARAEGELRRGCIYAQAGPPVGAATAGC